MMQEDVIQQTLLSLNTVLTQLNELEETAYVIAAKLHVVGAINSLDKVLVRSQDKH